MKFIDSHPSNIYSVSSLTKELQSLLQEQFEWVQVKGEISNFKPAASGHIYFSLKDKNAVLSCVAWRSTASRWSGLHLQDGMEVVVGGSISLYPPRGQYQLVVSSLRLEGTGTLQIQFEALKHRLFEEGLFAEEHKQGLPVFPQKIAVVTSPTGAALRDFLRVLHQNKCPVPVMVCPVLVQGNEAAGQIVEMLDWLNQKKTVDVIVLTRGGGSLEDLWAFNEEIVARAVFRSTIPVISAIGHEIDYTISDFVSDLRASTPTAAAQLVSNIFVEHLSSLRWYYDRLKRSCLPVLQQESNRMDAMGKALKRCHPKTMIMVYRQRLDEWHSRMSNRILSQIAEEKKTLQIQQMALLRTIHYNFQRKQNEMERLKRMLESRELKKTLSRGYAICRNAKGIVVRDVDSILPGDDISVRVFQGGMEATVTKVERK